MENEFLAQAGAWFTEAWASVQAHTANSLEWLTGSAPDLMDQAIATLQQRADDHPIVAAFAIAAVVATLLVTRNILALIAAAFFAIAALVGTEPVTDPLARLVFPAGCLIALALLLAAIAIDRRRGRQLRRQIGDIKAQMAELQEKYDSEVRWRMAERRASPPIEERQIKASATARSHTEAKPAQAPSEPAQASPPAQQSPGTVNAPATASG
ncbi:hypothetical protein [Fulvimarina sp. MAC8]|uniref:hypothetical protein n=1 Tax=Fulvimarina sp. MAC8 TaxID=3162874 RepID=UPI0032EF2B7A